MSYLEGCTAPMRDENQLHAAVVELVALDDAQIKYSTVQNWYPGDEQGRGGIYNFVTKRGECRGAQLADLLDPGGNRLGDHLEIPELRAARRELGRRVLFGGASTNNYQQADTGTKMIHIGANTRSTIVSKGISAGHGAEQPIAGWCGCCPRRHGARNYHAVRLAADRRRTAARTPSPTSSRATRSAMVEHEASTSQISEDQLFYCLQRGLAAEDAVNMIVSGFCREVFKELPMEFAVEAQNLLAVSLEGAVG